MADSPVFFSDGHTPKYQDTKWRILQKILGALNDGLSNTTSSLNCALGMWVVPTVAELRMISTQDANCAPQWARTAGMDNTTDGQDSEYIWDGDCTDPDDGLSVVYANDNPEPGPGAWRSKTGVP